MKDYTDIIHYINMQVATCNKDASLDYREFLLKREAYQDVIDYINTNFLAPEVTSLSEYQVDYNCPARNGFIEAVETSI